MPSVLLNKRIEFAAAHRYVRPEWDEAKNRTVFGRCYNPPAHGHNYLLELTISGEIDPRTGMVGLGLQRLFSSRGPAEL